MLEFFDTMFESLTLVFVTFICFNVPAKWEHSDEIGEQVLEDVPSKNKHFAIFTSR